VRLAIKTGRFRLLTIGLFFLLFFNPPQAAGGQEGHTSGLHITKTALQPTQNWPLPPPGPPGLENKTIAYIGEDLRNAGILGVGAGVSEAARRMGWAVRFLDIGSGEGQRKTVFRQVLALRPDGIILGGVDAVKNLPFLSPLGIAGIPVIGWHVAPDPGPVPGTPVRLNIATDSVEVARAAAHYVVDDSGGRAGVVIFTDSRFAIARKKAATMAKIIRSCKGCQLLEMVDTPLDRTAATMPETTRRLLREYGSRWQYSLAINDLYFDHAVATLVMKGRPPEGPPTNISAGDGSPSALLRVRYKSYQRATVPEPLIFHGWQLVDELNRILQDKTPSGYKTLPSILTRQTLGSRGNGIVLDPANGYRKAYLNIWKRN